MKRLPRKNPDVVFRRVGDGGAVLLSTDEEIYYGLNEVGAEVWELLSPHQDSPDELRHAIAVKYPDVAADVIAADVTELLDDLVQAGLLLAPEDADVEDRR